MYSTCMYNAYRTILLPELVKPDKQDQLQSQGASSLLVRLQYIHNTSEDLQEHGPEQNNGEISMNSGCIFKSILQAIYL